jgi:hypothetical protein
MCDLENLVNEEAIARVGLQRHLKQINNNILLLYPLLINRTTISLHAVQNYKMLPCKTKLTQIHTLELRHFTFGIQNKYPMVGL